MHPLYLRMTVATRHPCNHLTTGPAEGQQQMVFRCNVEDSMDIVVLCLKDSHQGIEDVTAGRVMQQAMQGMEEQAVQTVKIH